MEIDDNFIISQLHQLVASLCDITELLNQFLQDYDVIQRGNKCLKVKNDSSSSDDCNALITAKAGILDSILALNIMHHDLQKAKSFDPYMPYHAQIMNDDGDKFIIGTIVLAPRYSLNSKTLCMDYAVIMPHLSLRNSDDTDESFKDEGDDIAGTPDPYIEYDLTCERVYLLWLRPQSRYELLCSYRDIYFSVQQLIRHTVTMCTFEQHVLALKYLQVGDRVLCRPGLGTDQGEKYWQQGLVSYAYNHGDDEILDIMVISTDAESYTVSTQRNIQNICTLPSENVQDFLSRKRGGGSTSTSLDNHAIKVTQDSSSSSKIIADDGRLYHDETNADEGFNYVKSKHIPSTHQQPVSQDDLIISEKALMELAKFGTWEKYTKGVGMKLLAKMGYRRGRGLGRNEQGLLVPVQGLLKALPAGLSLDFVKDENSSQKLEENKKMKNEAPIEEKSTVFDFLNTIHKDSAAANAEATSTKQRASSSVKIKIAQGSKRIF